MSLLAYGNTAPVVAPSTSWSTQLSLAQQEAQKIDKDALLYSVHASPQARHSEWTYDEPLQVTFTFVTPSTDEITIEFTDSSPTSTLKVEQVIDPSQKYIGLVDQDRRKKYNSNLATINLNPREAGLRTWAEASAQAHGRGIDIIPVIGVDLAATPAEWYIQYLDVARGVINLKRESLFRVNAQDGEILVRDLATPTMPTPPAIIK